MAMERVVANDIRRVPVWTAGDGVQYLAKVLLQIWNFGRYRMTWGR
jgi:hypothetical protein